MDSNKATAKNYIYSLSGEGLSTNGRVMSRIYRVRKEEMIKNEERLRQRIGSRSTANRRCLKVVINEKQVGAGKGANVTSRRRPRTVVMDVVCVACHKLQLKSKQCQSPKCS
jgi:hypothetical protein